MGRPKLVNLARSYAYQSKGYYASLLAEARGHRVVPTVETMLELREAKLYEHALPELEDELNRCARRADFQPEGEFKLLVCFGIARDERFESFGRLLFDWFRCPALEVIVEPGTLAVDRPHPAAQHHPAGQWRGELPARVAAPAHQARMARPQGAHDRQIRPRGALRSEREDAAVLAGTRSSTWRASPRSCRSTSSRSPSRQLAELAEYDGLFIRETTSIDNHTYRFARRAWQEGMPVIDDPISMIRCTNKVFLMELLARTRCATPPTVMLADAGDLPRAMDELGLPLVVKIPDGSFSRGVHKVQHAGGIPPHRRRAVRGDRPPAGAEIPADRVRLARRRARRRAAVRVPVPHGARPLADRQAPPRRLRARGRLSHLRPRPGAGAS